MGLLGSTQVSQRYHDVSLPKISATMPIRYRHPSPRVDPALPSPDDIRRERSSAKRRRSQETFGGTFTRSHGEAARPRERRVG
jgi:hypothetical protein